MASAFPAFADMSLVVPEGTPSGVMLRWNGTTFDLENPGAASTPDPVQQSYAPGSFTAAIGKCVIISRHLKLTGTQRATVQGDARIRIT